MTIFLDTGILLGVVNARDPLHRRSVAILDQVVEGRWGPAVTSDLVLVEGLTFLRSRVKRRAAEELLLRMVLGSAPKRIVKDVLKVHGSRFSDALGMFRRSFHRGLSFTDCSSLVLMKGFGIPRIATFDRGFRGLVEVVDAP